MGHAKSSFRCPQQCKKMAHDLNTQPFKRKDTAGHQATVGPQPRGICWDKKQNRKAFSEPSKVQKLGTPFQVLDAGQILP